MIGGYVEATDCRFNRINSFRLYSFCDVRRVSGHEMEVGYLPASAHSCLGNTYRVFRLVLSADDMGKSTSP